MKNPTKKQCPATALGIPNQTKRAHGTSSAYQQARILKHFESYLTFSTILSHEQYGIIQYGYIRGIL